MSFGPPKKARNSSSRGPKTPGLPPSESTSMGLTLSRSRPTLEPVCATPPLNEDVLEKLIRLQDRMLAVEDRVARECTNKRSFKQLADFENKRA